MALDQPNVGAHLQEHPFALVNWRSRDDDTLDDAANPRYLLPWLVAGRGKLSSNIAEAAIHWRSDPGLAAPDFQIVFGPVYFWEHGFRKTGAPALERRPGLHRTARAAARSGCAQPTRAITRASSTTCSARTPRWTRCCGRWTSCAMSPPGRRLPSSVREELNPSAQLRTRTELTQWIRATCEHEYHPTCTCRIGTAAGWRRRPASCACTGSTGLRVIDASVMPRVTSGNTNAPTLMIAERGAELILNGA